MPEFNYLSLQEAAASLPGKPHLSTLHRWRLRGVRGVRLETVLIGGRRFVDRNKLFEFVQAVTTAADGEKSPQRASSDQAIARAEEECKKFGI